MERPITLLTGATSGIGHETAIILYLSGHHLVLGNRNPEKAEILKKELLNLDPNGSFEMLEVDLASFESIKDFSIIVHQKYDHLDNLINNAGVFMRRKLYTKEGFEMAMGVNHLGTYYLTELLKDMLVENSKVVMVSSIGCYWGSINVKENSFTRRRNPFQNYFDSKLANLAYVKELADELKSRNIGVRAADPGVVYSHIWKWRSGFGRFLERIQRKIMKSAQQGALVVVSLVSDGRELEDDRLMFTLKSSRKLPKKIRSNLRRKSFVEHTKKAVNSAINANLDD